MNAELNKFINPDLIDGSRSAVPIFIGYFTTSTAFGILALASGLSPLDTVIFSMTNLTGAAQFMAINLMASSAIAGEIIISVALMNLRYFVMSASLSRKLGLKKLHDIAIISFGVTDEVFTVASLKSGEVSTSFMYGLQFTSWLGWVCGTFTGVTMGTFLPQSLQDAMSGSLFALFAALLVPEIKKGYRAALIAIFSGIINTLLYYICHMSAGWSIVISMLSVTAIAAAVSSDDPVSSDEIIEDEC